MKKTNAAVTLVVAAVLGTAGAAWAVPEVSNVTMAQRANSRIVDIGYTLASEEAIITLGIETNGVPLPDSAVTRLSGDVSTVVQPDGAHSIVWNAGTDWPEHSVTNAKARVTAWVTNSPPQYCVVDLTGGPNTNAYPVSYYTSVDALPYGGITNTVYKSTYLAMRRISAGSFTMGESTKAVAVSLTHDFYAGVFEVTQGQWYKVMSTSPANFNEVASQAFRPVEKVSYNDIRGTSALGGGGWPTNDSVYASSFIGLLQTKAGIAGFDLPTEAQWEYACRAGTATYYSDEQLGTPANITSNAQMDVLGRYQYDGGKIDGTVNPAVGCASSNGTAIAGTYLPNKWGLYDVHGNVYEWCLDWSEDTLSGGSDPSGPSSSSDSYRVFRGGSWNLNASYSRSAYRNNYLPTFQASHFGFRLVRTLP